MINLRSKSSDDDDDDADEDDADEDEEVEADITPLLLAVVILAFGMTTIAFVVVVVADIRRHIISRTVFVTAATDADAAFIFVVVLVVDKTIIFIGRRNIRKRKIVSHQYSSDDSMYIPLPCRGYCRF